MLNQVTETLQQVAGEPIALVWSLLLGLVSAVTSTCCTLPALGVLAGYSGSRQAKTARESLRGVVIFTVGTLLALMIVGAVAGFVGRGAQLTLGRWWKPMAALVAIALGLATLKVLPFEIRLPQFKLRDGGAVTGGILMGVLLGGIVAVSSLPCNPGIIVVIGAAVIQGDILWAILLLAAFAVGFAFPLALLMLGVSLGRIGLAAKGVEAALRIISGIILLATGFYFLVTF